MRVLLFARSWTRCTKPHWDQHLCSVRRLLLRLGAPGRRAVWDRNVRNVGTALSVAA
jgi:hypothetical protein